MIARLKQALLFLEDPSALWALVSWPTFSVTSYRMLRALERSDVRPKTVIDVGANIGQFAFAATRTFGDVTVHAFEPLPTAAATFRRRAARLRNVTLYEVALGDSDATATLRVSANSVSSSLLPMRPAHGEAFPDSATIENIEVRVTTLDGALSGVALARPVLLKIDAQGYEAHVLRGALAALAQVDHIVIEASLVPLYDSEPTFAELSAYLGERGFVFEAAIGCLEAPKTGQVLQLDALFRRV